MFAEVFFFFFFFPRTMAGKMVGSFVSPLPRRRGKYLVVMM